MRVLEAIRLVYPDYEAEICEDNEPASISPLVQSLYAKNRTEHGYNTDTLDVQDVMKTFKKQLEQERVGFGTIKSVERKESEDKHGERNQKSFAEIQSSWKDLLTRAIEREIELVKAENKGGVNIFEHTFFTTVIYTYIIVSIVSNLTAMFF